MRELTCVTQGGTDPLYTFFDGEEDLGTESGAINCVIGMKLTQAKGDEPFISGSSIDPKVIVAI